MAGKTGKDYAEIETKGCLALSLNKLAYTNRHRVKINVLTARQMNRLKYIYTGELNMD